jgi:hypothetical protein
MTLSTRDMRAGRARMTSLAKVTRSNSFSIMFPLGNHLAHNRVFSSLFVCHSLRWHPQNSDVICGATYIDKAFEGNCNQALLDQWCHHRLGQCPFHSKSTLVLMSRIRFGAFIIYQGNKIDRAAKNRKLEGTKAKARCKFWTLLA